MKNERKQNQPTKAPATDKPGGEDLWQRYGAEREVWSESMLTALHERRVRGNRWFSLVDKVPAMRTLEAAWSKVKANAGSGGVDGVNIAHFPKDWQKRLPAVNGRLREGSYHPSAVKRVYIPEAGSPGKRPPGIPTVRDRVVQGALKMVIEPIYEREFAPNSYGFRPGRGCKDDLREVERHPREGKCHVVDVDIKGYFDAVDHGTLMELAGERVSDSKVPGLIEAFPKQGIMEDGVETASAGGSPQGGLISPLLANIYLNPLDWLLLGLGLKSVRHADDIVVLAENAGQAKAALETIGKWTEKARLELHPGKTRTVDMSLPQAHFDFPGYRFLRTGKGKLLRLVRPKSEKKQRDEIRKRTKRCNANSMGHIIKNVNKVLAGWYGHYKHISVHALSRYDGWIRMRLRSILRKRHKGQGRGRGKDHFRWPNRYFGELGLFSLEQAKATGMSLQKRATC